jgi:predicted glycoside hydrolase/deacetylase ChbG (UPF0249 family)
MMPGGKFLIVNADDFGQSSGVNRGVIEAHERGIVTSASLMARWPAAAEAAAYGRERPSLGLGLHVDLGEWAYRRGDWLPLYEVVPANDAAAVEREVADQLEIFRRLVGKDPTHIDSHQHVHLREPVRSILSDIASGLGVPLRHFSPAVHYCGKFYGQTAEGDPLAGPITVKGLLKIIAALPDGVTELGCHPGDGSDLQTMYRDERAEEVKILCDPKVRATLVSGSIELRSFASVMARSMSALDNRMVDGR